MTIAGLAGCSLYIAEALSGRQPAPELLTAGLPNGRIRRAEVVRDKGPCPFIRVTMLDQHDCSEHQRIMNPEGFLLLRLLQLPKISQRIDHNQKPSEKKARQLHYIVVFASVLLARVIADAPPGRSAMFIGDHHDLRRQNLKLGDAQPSATQNYVHKDRDVARQLALANFDVAHAKGRLLRLPPLDRDQYRWLLETACALLDRVPMAGKSPT